MRLFLLGGESVISILDGTRPLIVDRSTTRRVAPTRCFELTIFNNARHCRIATGEGQHFHAPRAIRLRVIVNKGNAQRVVMIASLLTIRASRFRVDN